MFSLRLVLEAQNEVCDLHLTRIDAGVVYCRLADAGVQLQREPPGPGSMAAAGDPPAGMPTLSPGAEEGAEAVPPTDGSAA